MVGRARRWAAGSVVALALGVGMLAAPAGAQQQPPAPGGGQQPPGQQPPSTPPTSAPTQPDAGATTGSSQPSGPSEPDSGEVVLAARRAALALAREMALIDALGGFTEPPPAELTSLFAANDLVPAGDRAVLLAALDEADAEVEEQVAVLTAEGVALGPRRLVVVAPLEDADRAALEADQPISIPANEYNATLADLLQRNGRPDVSAAGEAPDLALITQTLSALFATEAGEEESSADDLQTATTGDAGSVEPATDRASEGTEDGDGDDSTVPIVIGGGLFALIALATIVIFAMRRSRPAAGPEFDEFDDMLDVSRRLAAAVDPTDVERIAVGEAARMSGAAAGAIVHRTDDGYTPGFQSDEGILVHDGLGDGVVDRVCATARPVTQVSSTEPAVRNLPTSLLAVPIVADGQVGSVLLLVRSPDDPFRPNEVDRLGSLAPVVGAALENARSHGAAEERSLIDPLTAVGNRRRLEAELSTLLADASDAPTAVVMVDLDHFKAVNDTHGHQAGDQVLQSVARTLRDHLRPRDAVYRYGGEEFCLVLPGADLDEAAGVAERVRVAVADRSVAVSDGPSLTVTGSMGVATSVGGSVEDLIARADAALYEAKADGRNRVVTAPPG